MPFLRPQHITLTPISVLPTEPAARSENFCVRPGTTYGLREMSAPMPYATQRHLQGRSSLHVPAQDRKSCPVTKLIRSPSSSIDKLPWILAPPSGAGSAWISFRVVPNSHPGCIKYHVENGSDRSNYIEIQRYPFGGKARLLLFLGTAHANRRPIQNTDPILHIAHVWCSEWRLVQ